MQYDIKKDDKNVRSVEDEELKIAIKLSKKLD